MTAPTRRDVATELAAVGLLPGAVRAQAVRWSGGTERPHITLPPGTVDCHHHIFDARYPADPKAPRRPVDASIADYRGLQARLGFRRHVVVQPSVYGTDNRCLLDALATFGPEARGVVVVDGDVTRDELDRMHARGVRGVRFNLSSPNGAPATIMATVAARIAPLGWHVQVVAKPPHILEHADLFRTLPVPVVFDHLGQIGPPGVEDPAFRVVAGLLAADRAWVKISGLYTFGRKDAPGYPDAAALVRGYRGIAPHRLVWGTDWPHPLAPADAKPDDAKMVDLVADWLGDARHRTMAFATNPAKLYDFGRA